MTRVNPRGRHSRATVEKILSTYDAGTRSSLDIARQLALPESTVRYHLGKALRQVQRGDRARPVREVTKNCGCVATTYQASLAVKVCETHFGEAKSLLDRFLKLAQFTHNELVSG